MKRNFGITKVKNRILAITVQGFKSICSEQRLDIRPLTILAGANSLGKSSMMQPLLLLKQTLEAPGDPGALLLDGPNVRFTMASQMFSKTLAKNCADEFRIGMEMLDGTRLELLFRRDQNKMIDIAQMVYTQQGRVITITPKMS